MPPPSRKQYLSPMEKTVLIIGGGPAGLFAALAAAEAGAAVTLLERNARPGAKLLLSGAGQCNCTHAGPLEDFFNHYGDHGAFLRPALGALSNTELCRRFTELGVPVADRGDGKVFPVSEKANDLLTALEKACREAGVTLRNRERVRTVERTETGFAVTTDSARHDVGRYEAAALIIATGGRSYPKTGSTGDGCDFAAALGHTIVPLTPALCGILCRDHWLAEATGLALPGCTVRLLRDGAVIKEQIDDALVTPWGLSGPALLHLCRWVRPGDTLALTPAGLDAARLAALPDFCYSAAGKQNLRRVIHECGLPLRLAELLCRREGLDPARRAAEIGKKQLTALAASCREMRLTVADTRGWEEAMATAGGVSLAEVDPETMQSKIIPGLFFAGEVLDIDGDSGGYNIQAACATGRLAGLHAGP